MARVRLEQTKLHCNIGTIGRVDHGKTTLTTAITKMLRDEYPGLNELSPLDSTDKTLEERQCGITISIAHVEYRTGGRHYAHVDCPGHANYVKNMITGAAQIDGTVLAMAVTDGPMAQIHRHILLIRQTGVPITVVALNKCDMIAGEDVDLIDLVEMELCEILSTQEFDSDNLPVVRMVAFPALNDDEKWVDTILELMDAVDEYIPQPERDTEKPFLIPVGGVLTIAGRDTVIIGRIERGIVKIGDTADPVGIRPEKQTTTVTGIEILRKVPGEGRAGESVDLLLRGTREEDVERGMVVIRPGSTTPHTDFEATIYVFNKEEGGRYKPLFSSYSPQLYFRTTGVTSVVQLPEGREMAMPGDNTDITIHLSKSIAMEESPKFAIREGGRTIGAGKVTKTIK